MGDANTNQNRQRPQRQISYTKIRGHRIDMTNTTFICPDKNLTLTNNCRICRVHNLTFTDARFVLSAPKYA